MVFGHRDIFICGNILKLDFDDGLQLQKFTKKYLVVHLNWVTVTVCKLYLHPTIKVKDMLHPVEIPENMKVVQQIFKPEKSS